MSRRWLPILLLAAIAAMSGVLFRYRLDRRSDPNSKAPTAAPIRPQNSPTVTSGDRASAKAAAAPSASAGATISVAEAGLTPPLEELLARPGVTPAQVIAALRADLAELTPSERSRAIEAAGEWLVHQPPNAANDVLAALDEYRDRYALVKTVVESLTRDDPAAAAQWATKLSDPTLRENGLNMVGMAWAATNRDSALAWASALPADQRASALEGVAWTWAQSDPAAAATWALQLNDPAVRDDLLVKISKMMAVKDGRAAAEWTQQFPPGNARDTALHYAVFQWAAQDLDGASRWVAQLPDPALRAETELAVARSWATYEGEGATQWAATIEDRPARTAALETTLQKWAQTNPDAAARWLGQNTASTEREPLVRAVTAGLLNSNAAAADRWIATLSDPSLRAVAQQFVDEYRTTHPHR